MTRNKGDKDYTKSEKQLLIFLINDYSLFGGTDSEIIQMLSVKIGTKISETLFYRLKKEAVQVLVEEKENQNKSLINQLSKTIAENTKVVDSFCVLL